MCSTELNAREKEAAGGMVKSKQDWISRRLRIGPIQRDWVGEEPKGECAHCGGQCAPECGLHPIGCVYGGLEGYWLIVDGCPLYHGEVSVSA